MRRRLWSDPFGALALALGLVMIPAIAAAQAVTVIRGSEVSVVQGPGGFAEEARRDVARPDAPKRSADRASPAPAEPPRRIVILFPPSRDYAYVAWQLVNPWKTNGIVVHGTSD
jgi:hypothetical protein